MTEDKFIDNPDHPVELTDGDVEVAVAKYPFLVVDCWAQWCGPCLMIAPAIKNLAKKHQGSIVFGKLDVDSNSATAVKYGIRSIPNLIVFKNGQKVGDIIGAMPEDRLLDEINSYR